MLHKVIEAAMLEFSNGFPSVMKTEVNEKVEAVYVYTTEGFYGLPDGFFWGMEFKYGLKVSRIDSTDSNGARICFKKQ